MDRMERLLSKALGKKSTTIRELRKDLKKKSFEVEELKVL